MGSTFSEHAHISEASVNKSELVDSIAEGAGLSKADAERALNALIDSVQGAVAGGDKVTLPGFGSFSVSHRGPPRPSPLNSTLEGAKGPEDRQG